LLKDKVAIVSGANRGLGLEISKKFAERGATVIMCSRSMASAENSASWIKGKTHPERSDVTNAQRIEEFMRCMAERHKHIDILINNAGYPFDRMIWNKSFHEVSEEDLEKIIDAAIAASIASEDFAFATGNTIVIDGGTVML
jgi:NAD(P)-dependent dehydrogenase (short-subunit alcohol dehydrogenase family)